MTNTNSWTPLQKFLFRFFFIYLIIYIEPLTWGSELTFGYLREGYYAMIDWMVNLSNHYLFKTYPELVPINGSGDTSWAYTHLKLFLLLSFLVALIWSLLDRKKAAYPRWGYVLNTIVRYKIAMTAFGYGIIKLFALQMFFPSMSQLATPLGEFLPMRFSWLFIGYSAPYQIFSGIMEVLAGLLLFNRRTVTTGLLVSLGVFANVLMLNLAYDIPVKLYSAHLVVLCIFLLVQEHRRLVDFLLLNKTAAPSVLYQPPFALKKWHKITRRILKLLFVVFVILLPLYGSYQRYKGMQSNNEQLPIRSGFYDVDVFALNKDTIPAILGDSTRWTQMILHPGTGGSLISSDSTLFYRMYGRAYFNYLVDTARGEINFKRPGSKDTTFTLRYTLPDSNTIQLKGRLRNDSLYLLLRRNNKQYRLAEKQFHWLSEYNR